MLEGKKQNFLHRDFIWTLSSLLILSLPFWFSDLDLRVQALFYVAPGTWPWVEHPFWDFIYRYGIFLGYVVALISLFLIAASYWFPKYITWRKPALLMVFTLALGPGLLINLVFKEHWGRPRPREVVTFQGSEEFVHLWVMGSHSNGKSFPCGHCSMGFYLAVPFLFLRKRRRKWAYAFLAFGIGYGLLIGMARMMAGAHFLSDVLWAGGLVWLSALIGYYAFKVYEETPKPSNTSPLSRKKAQRMTFLIGSLLPILTVMLLLATPYISSKEFRQSPQELAQAGIKVSKTSFEEGIVSLNMDSAFQVKYQVNAFGFPNSKVRIRQEQIGDTSLFTLYKTGWFTEINPVIDVQWPVGEDFVHILEMEKGKVQMDISTFPSGKIHILLKEADISLVMPKNADIYIRAQTNQKNQFENQTSFVFASASKKQATYGDEQTATLKLYIQLDQGKLILKDRPSN